MFVLPTKDDIYCHVALQMIEPNSIYRVKRGDFAGCEATFVSQSDGLVTFNTNILGNIVPFTLAVDEIDTHIELFADVPAAQNPEHVGLGECELHSLHENADTIFQAHFAGSDSVFSTIQLSHSPGFVKVAVNKLNLTWPASSGAGHRITTNKTVELLTWHKFASLIDRIGFWDMQHDDGIRIPSNKKPKHFHLLGWSGGRFHEVKRQTIDQCQISAACQFLANLDPDAQYST